MLGQISLNVSFWIYLILYLPQIMHNKKQANLDGLSKWMHMILYSAYSLDLLYGFESQLPWQYRSVSCVGWLLLTIQHLQLSKHFKQKQQYKTTHGYYASLLLMLCLLIYGLSLHPFSTRDIDLLGYMAQLGFIGAIVPQIMKSKQMQSAQAISLTYIFFNLLLSCLDAISAWTLAWGWPNKLGSMFLLVLMSIMLIQHRLSK